MNKSPNTKAINVIDRYDDERIKGGDAVSFLNLASIGHLLDDPCSLDRDLRYFCDGKLLCLWMRLLSGRIVERVSFDYTSIAHTIFRQSVEQGVRLYFIGATEDQVVTFCEKVKNRYPGVRIAGYCHGYHPTSAWPSLIDEICASGADVLIAGLGAGRQEAFIELAKIRGFRGSGFTCGGFIRQVSETELADYYPSVVNRLGLRAFYRMYREPHTIRRYLLDYPVNLMRLLFRVKYVKDVAIRINEPVTLNVRR